MNPPIELSSTFVGSGSLEDASYVYGRFSTPAWTPFEEALAELEHASLPGPVFGSGLAAIAAALSLVPRGGTLIMPRHCYQGSLQSAAEVSARAGFDLVTVDIADTDEVLGALDSVTAASAMLWIESPTNPMLEVADTPALIAGAKERGVLTVVDNTFATPLLQTPLDLGADIVVHSVTKYLAGHSEVVLGAVVTSDGELHGKILAERSLRGASRPATRACLRIRVMSAPRSR